MSVDTEAPPGIDPGSNHAKDGSRTSPEGGKRIELREKAKITSEVLISRGVDTVVQNHLITDGDEERIDTSRMSDDEYNLYSVGLFRVGFTEEEYGDNGKEVKGGLLVKTTDDKEVTITNLLSDDFVDGKRIYKAKTEIDDPDNPGSKKVVEVDVDAEEIVRAHMTNTADSIAENFTDTAQKDLIRWHASGDPGDPPESAKALIEKEERNPVDMADEYINKVSTAVQLEINNLKSKNSPTSEEKTALAIKEQLVGKLRLLKEINGENFAELARLQALLTLQQNGIENLEEIIDTLEPGANAAMQTLRERLINESGATDADLELLEEKGFDALIENPNLVEKLVNVEKFDQMIFGREVSEEELRDMLSANIPPELIDQLKKAGLWTGKKAGLLALILLAIPAAVAVGVTYTVASGAAAGGGRR